MTETRGDDGEHAARKALLLVVNSRLLATLGQHWSSGR